MIALTPGQFSLCTDIVAVACAGIGLLVLACSTRRRP